MKVADEKSLFPDCIVSKPKKIGHFTLPIVQPGVLTIGLPPQVHIKVGAGFMKTRSNWGEGQDSARGPTTEAFFASFTQVDNRAIGNYYPRSISSKDEPHFFISAYRIRLLLLSLKSHNNFFLTWYFQFI